MRILLYVLLILLIPLFMNGQDVKVTVNKDTIALHKQSVNIIDAFRDPPSKDNPPKNIIKIAGFAIPAAESVVGIVSLGYERKINENFSCEVVGFISNVGSQVTTKVYSFRPGVKYYYTQDHKAYISMFLRYQQNKYYNGDPLNPDYTVTGYGAGGMMGVMADISRIVKLDIGVGLFYSYRTPTPRKSDDQHVFAKGLYLLPRIHLGFCF